MILSVLQRHKQQQTKPAVHVNVSFCMKPVTLSKWPVIGLTMTSLVLSRRHEQVSQTHSESETFSPGQVITPAPL